MEATIESCALIFDLDGVLLNTEPFYTQATQTIVGRFGKTFDWAIKANMIGRPSLDSARYLVGELELPMSPEDYLSERKVELERLFPNAAEIAGAEAFVRRAAAAGIPMAVATSSERRLFELKTSRHQDWFACFDAVVCGDDAGVKNGKPAPDIFLAAASAIGVEPRGCVVFEDSPVGVQAAVAARMRVVAVPDPMMDKARYGDAIKILSDFTAALPTEFLGL